MVLDDVFRNAGYDSFLMDFDARGLIGAGHGTYLSDWGPINIRHLDEAVRKCPEGLFLEVLTSAPRTPFAKTAPSYDVPGGYGIEPPTIDMQDQLVLFRTAYYDGRRNRYSVEVKIADVGSKNWDSRSIPNIEAQQLLATITAYGRSDKNPFSRFLTEFREKYSP